MESLYIVKTLLRFFIEVLALIFTSLLIVNILYELDIFNKLSNIVKPLARLFKIPEPYLMCLSMAFISPTVSYTMLIRLKEERSLSDDDIFPILILTSPITQLCDTLRFGFPIAISVLSVVGGLIYLAFGLFRSITRLIIHAIYVSKRRKIVPIDRFVNNRRVRRSRKEILYSSFKKTLSMFKRISIRFSIATGVVCILIIFNIFNMITNFIKPLLQYFGFNTYMISIVMVQIFHFLTALYLAGTFFNQGFITLKQVFITIFTGNLIAIPIVHFRHYLPYRASLFGFRLAIRWIMFDLCTSLFTNVLALLMAIYVL